MSFRKKVFVAIAVFVLLIGGIILTVLSLQKRQNIRQEAFQNAKITEVPLKKEVSFYFTEEGKNNPLKDFSLRVGEQIVLSLNLNTKGIKINGFDITINSSDNLSFFKLEEGIDAKRFNIMIFDGSKNQRFAKVSTNIKDDIRGKLHLATITFVAKSTGLGSITLPYATITTIERNTPIGSDRPVITYTIN